MSTRFDDTLRARFDALAPDPGRDDWLAVHRRARTTRRRHQLVGLLVAAAAFLLVGCTAAFGPRVVDFFAADPSPPHVIDFLSAATAPNDPHDRTNVEPQLDTSRRIVDERFAGGDIQIDLTPLVGGGFCLTERRISGTADGDWSDCATPAELRATPLVVTEPDGRSDDYPLPGGHVAGATSVVGWVATQSLDRIEIGYEDGSRGDVDFFRVSKPIDAAFFLLDIPERNTHFPRRANALYAYDGDGHEIARATIANQDPDEWTFPRFHDTHGFPPAADRSRIRTLHFPGARATITLAPAKGGVTCFIFHTTSGSGSDQCLRNAQAYRLARLGPAHSLFAGDGQLLLWGLVERDVRTASLTFEDGDTTTTRAQERFVLYPIPERHLAAGSRLRRAVLRDAGGRVVRVITFDPGSDVYP